MTRWKSVKPPTRLPPIKQIARVTFRFDDRGRRELMAMLPPRSMSLWSQTSSSSAAAWPKQLVEALENEIVSHRTVERLTQGSGAPSRASIVRAIRDMRQALDHIWAADAGTVDVLLGAFLGTSGMFESEAASTTFQRVDTALAERERLLSTMRMGPGSVRNRQVLIKQMGDAIQTSCTGYMTRVQMARMLAHALDLASIEHDDPKPTKTG